MRFLLQKNNTKTGQRHLRVLVVVFLCLLGGVQQVFAQQTVSGTVKDQAGLPLPSASIKVKGTNAGTQTDKNGSFTISLPSGRTILTVSYVGYEAVDVNIASKGFSPQIMLTEAASSKEVVVVGYGTQKKVNLTGAVATVSGTVMTERPVTDAANMLQGVLPGVDVMQTTGQPGEGNTNIQVRGFGTFSGAGANPLILVDGVPGNMEDLNPSTIESVSVLKDAASAAIYGSRAANGVILVTTKSGANNNGAFKVEYDFNYGSNSPTRLLDLVSNSPDYMRAWNTYITNSNYGVPVPSEQYTAAEIAEYTNPANSTLYPSFDWEHYMVRAAPTTMHNLTISGGKQTHYNFSLGYVDQNGTMAAFDYKRYNASFNIVSDVSKKLKVGAIVGLKSGTTLADAYGQENYFLTVLSQPPTELPTLPGQPGLYSWRAFPFESNNWNPVEELKEQNTTTNDYALTAQIWADLEIVKGLHWYTKGAANYATSQYTQFSPNTGYERLYSDPSVLGYNYSISSLTEQNSQNIYTNLYSYLTYEKRVGLHNFNLMTGYSSEDNKNNSIAAYRSNFASSSTPELNAGGVNGQTNNGDGYEWAILSGFARLSYNYNSKYLFEANVRSDGTSRLSSSTRWGTFPSFSGAWRISQESFMESSKSWLTDLKLRGSWGKLGNQNIGNYPYQSTLSLTGAYPFNGTSLSPGVAQTALANPAITWEKTTTSDIGLDVTLLGKLSLTFDVYKKLTSDILNSAQVPAVVGLAPPVINYGTVQNTGFDLAVNYQDKVKSGILEGMSLGAGGVLSAFKNKLVQFGAPQDNGNTIDQVGLPYNTFYVLKVTGIFQNAAQIAAAPKQFGENTQPGMLQFADVNHDGVINNSDRVPIKNGVFPAFTYGFHFNAAWRGFDLYGFIQGVAGSKIFANGWGVEPFIQGTPPTKEQVADAWTPQNHSNTMVEIGDPVPTYTHPSTYNLFDNSYMRLKTLQIGYSLPASMVSKFGMSKLRFYIAGDNLLTFTKYPGLDPERAQPANYYGFYPFDAYPQNRVISFGCNVTF
jgi:TonB-linked SusC/RagA family outer membrane protein